MNQQFIIVTLEMPYKQTAMILIPDCFGQTIEKQANLFLFAFKSALNVYFRQMLSSTCNLRRCSRTKIYN